MSKYHHSPVTYVEGISLNVMDINKSKEFYNNVLGFEVIEENASSITMGVDGRNLLILNQVKTKRDARSAGLYHIAYLVPDRKDLANWLYYHAVNKTRIDGASNHGVSEAIYLHDVDGNGIEIYTDTPDSKWELDNGRVGMVTEAIDADGLFKIADNPTNKLPNNTIVGHIHLSVLDLDESKKFYNLLGFDVVLEMHSAVFLSNSKYHHHIGMNIWHSKGGSIRDNEQTGINNFTIKYPSKEEVDNVLKNLDNAGFAYKVENNLVTLNDVNNIEVHLVF